MLLRSLLRGVGRFVILPVWIVSRLVRRSPFPAIIATSIGGVGACAREFAERDEGSVDGISHRSTGAVGFFLSGWVWIAWGDREGSVGL